MLYCALHKLSTVFCRNKFQAKIDMALETSKAQDFQVILVFWGPVSVSSLYEVCLTEQIHIPKCALDKADDVL